jgi:hypothetical protein
MRLQLWMHRYPDLRRQMPRNIRSASLLRVLGADTVADPVPDPQPNTKSYACTNERSHERPDHFAVIISTYGFAYCESDDITNTRTDVVTNTFAFV